MTKFYCYCSDYEDESDPKTLSAYDDAEAAEDHARNLFDDDFERPEEIEINVRPDKESAEYKRFIVSIEPVTTFSYSARPICAS